MLVASHYAEVKDAEQGANFLAKVKNMEEGEWQLQPEADVGTCYGILSAIDPKETNGLNKIGAGIAVGVALGVALGAAIGNVGAGIAIGIAIGAAIGASQNKKNG